MTTSGSVKLVEKSKNELCKTALASSSCLGWQHRLEERLRTWTGTVKLDLKGFDFNLPQDNRCWSGRGIQMCEHLACLGTLLSSGTIRPGQFDQTEIDAIGQFSLNEALESRKAHTSNFFSKIIMQNVAATRFGQPKNEGIAKNNMAYDCSTRAADSPTPILTVSTGSTSFVR
ncbi:hypothetical protein T265_11521 [Opisthorchis viverrini]|uniref:Uncharacterized protein n=1 Tax=Opisthorchis viverrini TaxID=6198 RepID=A0A074YYB6_OPIVI|nr:hypothetical protein T265_11521 [Opisthorchis viverrini]KER19786.1 hypothetical protein T265_11521 [Opisthorchis viverrini]